MTFPNCRILIFRSGDDPKAPLHERTWGRGFSVNSTAFTLDRVTDLRCAVHDRSATLQDGEERSRARAGQAAANLATLRRLALNLLKQDRTRKRGIKGKQLNASCDHAYLLRLLAF